MGALKRLFITVIFTVAATGYIRASATDDPNLLFSNQVFQQLVTRLNALEEQIAIQQHRIAEQQNESQQNRISELEARDFAQQKHNGIQQHHIEELESRDLAQHELISDLGAAIRDQQQQMKELNDSLTENNKAFNNLLDVEVNGIKEQNEDSSIDDTILARRQQSGVTNVAFTVILTHAIYRMGLGQNVRFDKVETNIRNAYSTHTGLFIAPVAGTYVFHVTLYVYRAAEGWCKIVVNGVKK